MSPPSSLFVNLGKVLNPKIPFLNRVIVFKCGIRSGIDDFSGVQDVVSIRKFGGEARILLYQKDREARLFDPFDDFPNVSDQKRG